MVLETHVGIVWDFAYHEESYNDTLFDQYTVSNPQHTRLLSHTFEYTSQCVGIGEGMYKLCVCIKV